MVTYASLLMAFALAFCVLFPGVSSTSTWLFLECDRVAQKTSNFFTFAECPVLIHTIGDSESSHDDGKNIFLR